METDPTTRRRRSIRLKGYDYSRAGAYFITVCTRHRGCLFGDILGGEMYLNGAGRMVQTIWNGLPIRFQHIQLDEFICMPNHLHGIIIFTRKGGSCIDPDIGSESNDRSGGQRSGGQRSGGQRSGEHKVRPYGNGGDQDDFGGRPHGTLPDTVGRIVQAFKSITTHEYINGVKQNGWVPFPGKLWQRNYWEHVVRNESELNLIREYIAYNSAGWETDGLNDAGTPGASSPAAVWMV